MVRGEVIAFLSFPLPLWERVVRAKRGPGEGSGLASGTDPSPGSCSLSLRTRHPLPQGERGRVFAAQLSNKCSSRLLLPATRRRPFLDACEVVVVAVAAAEPHRADERPIRFRFVLELRRQLFQLCQR